MQRRIAIVAALEREVKPAVKNWRLAVQEHDGRRFRFFEGAHTVLVCGGIGPGAARRAAEAIIRLYSPDTVVSLGFAGALEEQVKVGELLTPRVIIDATDGARTEAETGDATLVSFGFIAGPDQKRKLARAYAAQAVDMEAAAVACSARAHNLRFFAVKAISDELQTTLPCLQRFVAADGGFRAGAFLLFVLLRPWHWGATLRLAKNSSRARKSLCRWLNQYNDPEFLENKPEELHPISKAPS